MAQAHSGNPYLYTGRRFEPETGLYDYRARYLVHMLGRFISQDPLVYGANCSTFCFKEFTTVPSTLEPIVVADPPLNLPK